MVQTETRKQQVDYELVVVDELPPKSYAGGGGKSILNEQLDKIRENVENGAGEGEWGPWYGKPVRIGLYTKGTAATAAKNVLQQRNGRGPAVLGWKFETRRVPNDPTNPDSGTKMGLFAIYTPDKIIEGALAAHRKTEEVRKAKLDKLREEMAERADAGEDDEEEEGEETEGEEEDEDEEDEEEEAEEEVPAPTEIR